MRLELDKEKQERKAESRRRQQAEKHLAAANELVVQLKQYSLTEKKARTQVGHPPSDIPSPDVLCRWASQHRRLGAPAGPAFASR